MDNPVKSQLPARLYFFPESFDLEAQPEAFKAAYCTIIVPAYEQLVVAPRDALEKSSGSTLVFLLVKELLEQQELGLEFDLAETKTDVDREKREKEFNRHLRLVSAKQTAINSLIRVRKLAQQPRFYNPPIR